MRHKIWPFSIPILNDEQFGSQQGGGEMAPSSWLYLYVISKCLYLYIINIYIYISYAWRSKFPVSRVILMVYGVKKRRIQESIFWQPPIPIASMYGILTHIYHILPLKTTIHVGKYTSAMDGMGYIYQDVFFPIQSRCLFSKQKTSGSFEAHAWRHGGMGDLAEKKTSKSPRHSTW